MTNLERMPSIRCTFVKKDGVQCGRWAIRGGTVCPKHGGSLPNVKAKAAQRVEEAKAKVLELVPKAVVRLEELLDSGNDAVALKAVETVLDRAGYVVVRRTEAKVEQTVGVDEALRDLMAKRLAEASGGSGAVLDVEGEDVEDAEVVADAETEGVQSSCSEATEQGAGTEQA